MTIQSIQMGGGKTPEEQAAAVARDKASAAKGAGVTITQVDNNANNGDGSITVTPGQNVAQRPANVPEKFWDAATGTIRQEALLQSYVELEQKQSGKPAQQQQEQKPNGEQKPNEQQQAPNANQQTAIDAAAAEFSKDGKLSDASYASLEKAGLPKQIVDNYIAGETAKANALRDSAFKETGGEDNYTAMSKWAAEKLTEAELAAYNKDVNDPARSATAVAGLYARFQREGNYEPTTVQLGATGAPVGDAFKSRHELQAAMSDPKYKAGDKAFHAEVQRKMQAAMNAGINLFL